MEQQPICGDVELPTLDFDQLHTAHSFEFTKDQVFVKAHSSATVGEMVSTKKIKTAKITRIPKLAHPLVKADYDKEVTKQARQKAETFLKLLNNCQVNFHFIYLFLKIFIN